MRDLPPILARARFLMGSGMSGGGSTTMCEVRDTIESVWSIVRYYMGTFLHGCCMGMCYIVVCVACVDFPLYVVLRCTLCVICCSLHHLC